VLSAAAGIAARERGRTEARPCLKPAIHPCQISEAGNYMVLALPDFFTESMWILLFVASTVATTFTLSP